MLLFDKIKEKLFDEEPEEETMLKTADNEDYVEETEVNSKSTNYSRNQNDSDRIKQAQLEEAIIGMNDIDEGKLVNKNDNDKQRSKFNIIADDNDKKAETSPIIQRINRPLERKEFEMPQVISPIYGVKEDVEKKKSRAAYVPQPSAKRDQRNPLGTVISPYYGAQELEEFAEKAQREITNEQIVTQSSLNEDDYIVDDDKDTDIDNISIENLIKNEEDDDGLIQLSIFGDDKIIKEDEYTQEIEVNNQETDDDLPF